MRRSRQTVEEPKGDKKGVEIKQGPHAGADLPVPAPRLKDYYENTVRARLQEQFSLANVAPDPDGRKDRR